MRILLVLLGLLVTGTAQASIDCSKQPDCASLGFVNTDDDACAADGYIYCPFDPTYKKCVERDCEKLGFTESDKTSWCADIIKCKGDEKYTLCAKLPPCKIGDVYYADGSCGDVSKYTKDSDKTPVGVVFYVTDNGHHGKAIALHDIGMKTISEGFNPADPFHTDYRLYWGYFNHDISSLHNYSENEKDILEKIKDHNSDFFDGKGNTDKILEATAQISCSYTPNTQEYYQNCIAQAAQAAHDFYPPEVSKGDPIAGAGHWYLAALGEWMDVYGYDTSKIKELVQSSGATATNKGIINKTLSTLQSKNVPNATPLSEAGYWTSTEFSAKNVWLFRIQSGVRTNAEKSQYTPSRPFLAF